MQCMRTIRHRNAQPRDLDSFCLGPCKDLRVRGAVPMPAWFARHPCPPKFFGRALLRCDLCQDRSEPRKLEDGSFVIMEPADSSSSSVNMPWDLSRPLDEGEPPYYVDGDSSFILDPEPLDNSDDVCKATELVSTSATMARSNVSHLQYLTK